MPSDRPSGPHDRAHLHAAIRYSLREVIIQLSLLNHQVSGRLDLRDIDLDCLSLIQRHGPLRPSEVARRAGLHPATMTGILDRLEHGRWIERQRDPADRRAVIVSALPDRTADIMRLYAGMNAAINKLCAGYTDRELETLADFLQRTAEAGWAATEQLERS
jgi:DNA-binding MarR family transcriptional regulator